MQGLPQIIEITTALCVLTLSAIWDIRQRRIPNIVTFPAITAGVILTAVWRMASLPVTVIALILLFIFGTLRLMGQGDVKLIMALTALCGPAAALISAGIAAIFIVFIQLLRRPKETAAEAKTAIVALTSLNFGLINRNGRSIPFAPYILAGFICHAVYRVLF